MDQGALAAGVAIVRRWKAESFPMSSNQRPFGRANERSWPMASQPLIHRLVWLAMVLGGVAQAQSQAPVQATAQADAASAASTDAPAPIARLAVVGAVDTLLVGQAGYCGAMRSVDRFERSNIVLKPGVPVYLRVQSLGSIANCLGDASFQPAPNQAYIARLVNANASCFIELFRVRKGEAPVRDEIVAESPRSCVGQ